MIFRQISLKNWKNFASAQARLSDRVILVGPNAAGKSNFLDAFRFLRDLASSGGGFQEAIARRGGVTAIRSLAARSNPDVTLHVQMADQNTLEEWEYTLTFGQKGKTGPAVVKEVVRRAGKLILSRPNEEDTSDRERRSQTFLEQVNVNREFRELAIFFSSIRYLHIVPQLVREPDRSIGRSRDPFGGDFLDQMAITPEGKRKSRLKKIQQALQVAVPQLEEIELSRDALGAPHLRGKYQHWRPQGAWQTEDQFSDGTLRLMGLLWAVLEDEGPLLLEEPELSLHSTIVRALPQMLARLQRKRSRQIFLSTHSPELLHDEGIGLDEVLLFRPGNEGTEITSADCHKDIQALLAGGVSMADAVIPKTRPQQVDKLSLFSDL